MRFSAAMNVQFSAAVDNRLFRLNYPRPAGVVRRFPEEMLQSVLQGGKIGGEAAGGNDGPGRNAYLVCQ